MRGAVRLRAPGWCYAVLSRALLLALFWVPARGVVAQPSALAQAEQQLQLVQLDAARESAHRAIDAGGLGPQDLARAYEIVGVCASSVGSREEAYAAYVRMLALVPASRPSDILPPEKNRAFYDAQGFWLARRARLDLELAFDRPAQRLLVTISDPLGMAESLSHQLEPQAVGTRHKLARDQTELALALPPPAEPASFKLQLLDSAGNVLVERAEQLPPVTPAVLPRPALALTSAAPRVGDVDAPAPGQRRAGWRSPWLWAAAGVLVAGAATALTVWAVRDPDAQLRTEVSINPR